MKRRPTRAVQEAMDFVRKHPGKLNGYEIAEKFKISPVTVYRSDWWKEARKLSDNNIQKPTEENKNEQ